MMTGVEGAEERVKEVDAELAESTVYELLGGEEAVRSLVDRFYELMDQDATFSQIRDMHESDLSPMRQSLFEYLSGWLGGPQLFVERTGSPCLVGAHTPFTIGPEARDNWVICMRQAMADVEIDLKYRELLDPAFARIADMMQNAD